MYSQKVFDNFEECNYSYNPNDSYNTLGTSGNLDDGEIVKIYLQIEGDIVKLARFRAMGNIMTIAAAEELCKQLENNNVVIFETEIVEKNLSPIPDYREHCVVRVLEAYFDALQNFKG